jgi:hypothetical protein
MNRRIAAFIVLLFATHCISCGDSDQKSTSEPSANNATADAGAEETPDGGADAGTTNADAGSPDQGLTPSTDGPFAELYAQGLLRYAGQWEPTETTTSTRGADIHVFGDEDGPRCYTGEDYFVATRDGQVDDLMVFLQGGGFCAPGNCEATTQWPQDILPFGILEPTDQNPAGGFNVGYLPYCDGSLFSGDADHDVDGDGTIDRSFRGLKNLTASIELLARLYPSPPRILLIGNSAGGFAVHNALPILRAYYPDVPVEMVNDSAPGILGPGVMEQLSTYWNSDSFFPASCDDCISDDGPITGYHSWQLDQDPKTRLGYISSRQDEVVSAGLGGPVYEAALLDAVEALKQEHGDRFNSMIIQGADHTFVLRDFERQVGETTVRDWIGAMLSGGDWVSVTE